MNPFRLPSSAEKTALLDALRTLEAAADFLPDWVTNNAGPLGKVFASLDLAQHQATQLDTTDNLPR